MRATLLPCVVVALAASVLAPAVAVAERAVTGTVIADATGLPIAGALVSVGNGETTTDDHGRFRVGRVPFDRVDVVVIADGFGVYFGSARIGATLTIRLEVDAGSQELIRLSGHAPPAPPLHLDPIAIRTQPGAGNDVLRALQSLPGVARTPFGLGGLALRGTAPRDTKVYLDGIEIPLLYHFGGIASFLPTGAIDQVTLEPGGASVSYGRGLGGIALVTSRTGRRDRARVGGELSLIHVAALGEAPGPLAGSWLVGVRRSYFDAIIRGANLDLAMLPRYMDGQVRWESGDSAWMALLIASSDKLELVTDPNDPMAGGFDTSNVKSFVYTSQFVRLALRHRGTHGATSWTLLPSIGIDDVNARANHDDIDKGLHRTTVPLSLRAWLTTPVARGTLTGGFDGGWQHHAYDIVNTPPPTPMEPSPDGVLHRNLTRWSADAGAWLEQVWTGARVELRAGLRADHFGLSDQWTLDPRLAVNLHLPHDVTLIQSVGRYHEPPLVTDLDPIFGDRVMLGSSATQVATTVKAIVGDDKEVSATAYYQDLRQLPVDAITSATPTSANGSSESGGVLGISRELVDTQFGAYSYREAIGRGRAYGLELIVRKTLGPWTGWVAYTFGRSFRTNPARGDVEHPYVLDQPHALTVVGSTGVGRHWRLGGRLRYVTGNPLTPVDGAYRDASGDWVPVDGPILSDRLPDFVQLDVRLDRTWRRSWGVLDLYIDVQNAVNRANAEGVTYNEDFSRRSYTTGLPIFPAIGVEYVP